MPPEAWLSGPIEGIPPLLMPVAHALVQARRELEVVRGLSADDLWARPGDAASVGFHLRHIPGVIDRLLTYADERGLSEEQMAYLRAEGDPAPPLPDAAELLLAVDAAVERALAATASVEERELLGARTVGRAALPTNLLGLLFHIADHVQRHAGQVVTTVKVVCPARRSS